LHAGQYRIELGSVTAPAVRELRLVGAGAAGAATGEQAVMVEQNAWAQKAAATSPVAN
jgi:hypothetical protein